MKTASTAPDPLRAACDDMETRVAAAVAKTKQASNRLIDASLDLARAGRKISTPHLKAITDEPDEADRVADLTGKFTALRQPV